MGNVILVCVGSNTVIGSGEAYLPVVGKGIPAGTQGLRIGYVTKAKAHRESSTLSASALTASFHAGLP